MTGSEGDDGYRTPGFHAQAWTWGLGARTPTFLGLRNLPLNWLLKAPCLYDGNVPNRGVRGGAL